MKGRRELLRVGLPQPLGVVTQMIALTCAEAPDDAEVRVYNGCLIVDVPKDEPLPKASVQTGGNSKGAVDDTDDRLER